MLTEWSPLYSNGLCLGKKVNISSKIQLLWWGRKKTVLSFKAKVAYLVSYSGSDPDENSPGYKIFAQVYLHLTSGVCLFYIQLICAMWSWILTHCNFSSWKLKPTIWKSDTFRSGEASWKPIQDTALGHHIQTSLNFLKESLIQGCGRLTVSHKENEFKDLRGRSVLSVNIYFPICHWFWRIKIIPRFCGNSAMNLGKDS